MRWALAFISTTLFVAGSGAGVPANPTLGFCGGGTSFPVPARIAAARGVGPLARGSLWSVVSGPQRCFVQGHTVRRLDYVRSVIH